MMDWSKREKGHSVGNHSEKGFSLLEIMVVVIVIMLLTFLAKAPMAQYLQTLEQKHAVTGIRKLLQTARSRAMANPSVHCGVWFDMASNPPRAVPFQDTFAPGSYAYDAGKDQANQAPLDLPNGASLSIPSPYPAQVIYRGDGSAFLSAKLVVRMAGFTDTVDVLASTGRVRSTR
jgi:type II secretory pathway pseudopilin PulG